MVRPLCTGTKSRLVQYESLILPYNSICDCSDLFNTGITNEKQFVREALHCMKEFMTVDGNKVVYENVIEQESQRIFFSKIVYMKIVLLFHSCVLNDIKNTKILMST